MIHYHGTPIGGKAHSAAEFIVGRHVLIPWKRQDDLPKAMECARSFVVDNSAFSFWSSGEKPDWFEYYRWLETLCRHPRFAWAVIPDVIDGTETQNNDLIEAWYQFSAKTKTGINPVGVPVWHMDESIDRLRRLCHRFRTVAIGSSGDYPTPGVGKWWDRMDEVFDSITDEHGYPMAKIHGLRMLRRDIVERYPFSSCDSTNAVQNGLRESQKTGTDTLWGQLTLARRIEAAQSPSVWNRSEHQMTFELQAGP